MMFNDRRNARFIAKVNSPKAKARALKAVQPKPKKEPSALSKKIGGMMMGTGSSNTKTVKQNRAAIDSEMKKGY